MGPHSQHEIRDVVFFLTVFFITREKRPTDMEHTIGIMLGVYKDFPPPPFPPLLGGSIKLFGKEIKLGKREENGKKRGKGKWEKEMGGGKKDKGKGKGANGKGK